MAYKIILSPKAIEDLRDIVHFVALDREAAAVRLGRALIEKTKLLAEFPDMGRISPEFSDELIRELVLNPYRIIYRVDHTKQIIGIARYWHGARDFLKETDIG